MNASMAACSMRRIFRMLPLAEGISTVAISWLRMSTHNDDSEIPRSAAACSTVCSADVMARHYAQVRASVHCFAAALRKSLLLTARRYVLMCASTSK